MSKIGVIGAGTWGIALARMLTNQNHDVTVWSAIGSEIDELSLSRKQKNLPDMEIPAQTKFTKEMQVVCTGKEVLLWAVPSKFVRETVRLASPYLDKSQIIVNVAKGIELDSHFTMTQVIRDELQKNGVKGLSLVSLSGPTHAEEVAHDLPTTIVSACNDISVAEKVQNIFMNSNFRVYTNPDMKGVEICGAVKNVIALAVGISNGLGYGDNTRAALITRGIAEMTRLGTAMGCNKETFSGLAGIGDVVVTATSEHSRNYQCGYLIGKGFSVELMMRDKKSENHHSNFGIDYEYALLQSKKGFAMKRVITYGTYDLLHYGHINLLKRAKALGDYLIVVLSTDEFNWNMKHKKCYFTYEQRKALLESIRYVDLVIPEESWEQKVHDVHEYHADIFVIGDDWKGQFDFLKDEGVEVIYLERTPEISTTQIKQDLHEKK